MFMKKIIVFAFIFIFLFATACGEDAAEEYTSYANAMDTSAKITVYGKNSKAVADECAQLFKSLEGEFSVTDANSKLYTLNTNGSIEAEGHLYALCGFANELSTLTDGAYNPCIYPLVKLWGFTVGEFKVPTQEEIDENVKLIADSKMVFKDGGIYIENGGMVDLGGIAKGYASEMMRSLISGSDSTGAVISLGGNIVTVGEKPDGTPWSIGINSPQNDGGLIGTLSVGECAVVTSGSYIRNFEKDGKFYHHIIDPKTGKPVDNGLVSVTVVADDAALADGLSTAFFVMGIEESLTVAESLDVDVVFVTENSISISSGLKEKFTLSKSAEDEYDLIFL